CWSTLWVDDPLGCAGFVWGPGQMVGGSVVWEKVHGGMGVLATKLVALIADLNHDAARLDVLWQYATRHGLPVLLHTGTTFVAQAPLDCTLPRLLDRVAMRFPEVRMVLAHLGHPYEGECVAVIRKHPNVYADLSALHYPLFQLYHSLMLVQEYGVWDKVLFGTDYPFTNVQATLAGLRGLNGMLEGTALPRLDGAAIERLIDRDSLPLLGLA